jgi:hypothetical protein
MINESVPPSIVGDDRDELLIVDEGEFECGQKR